MSARPQQTPSKIAGKPKGSPAWVRIVAPIAVIGGCLGYVVVTESRSPSAPVQAAPREDPHQLVADGALLLDVRTRGEYGGGHIEGAVNVPIEDLRSRIGDLGAKTRPVVVYCASGARSHAAAQMLRSAGFVKVVDLGPMSAW